MGGHKAYNEVINDSQHKHGYKSNGGLYRSVGLVVLEIKLEIEYQQDDISKPMNRQTCTQNVQAMKADQFVKAIINIAAMRPFARVQIESFISGGGVRTE